MPTLQQQQKAYYQAHKEHINQVHKEWVSRNHEEVNTYQLKYQHEHYEQNKERVKADHCEWKNRLRIEVLTHYGNGQLKCVLCSETHMPCLSIDHINNNGAEERRELKSTGGRRLLGVNFYGWLRRNNFPSGYQTLCMNCQFVKKWEYEHKHLEEVDSYTSTAEDNF